MAFALFPLADSIRNRRALAVAFAVLGAWSITANASGAFISYRGWNQWALNDADKRLWLWGDNPVVDPFRSTLDSMRIALGHRPTSRNSPDLLDARLSVLNPPRTMRRRERASIFPSAPPIPAGPCGSEGVQRMNAEWSVWDGNGSVRGRWSETVKRAANFT